MKKSALIVLACVMIATMLVAAVKPALLTVKNRTDSDLAAYLFTDEDGVLTPVLYAAVPANSERQYELLPGEYVYEVYGCDLVLTGKVEIRGHFTLVLPSCARLDKVFQQFDGALKFFPE